MADIFISYSQGAPEPTQELALDLTKQSYTVWFDSRLLPMDVFWKVIREEMKAAKAVIVIWSPPSIDSDWVYAEAKLAHEMKKLICVRTPELDPVHVPMPFNGYNISPVSERQKIYDALAKLGLKAGEGPKLKEELEVHEVTVAWGEVRASSDRDDLQAFLEHYGDRHPFFAKLATKRIAALGNSVTPAIQSPAAVEMPKAEDVFLRIEAGMHTAPIRRIGVNAAGTMLVTGSDDKTARIWALPQNRSGAPELLRTLRVPIGEANEGRIYAVDLSPDGEYAAAGGWDAEYVGLGRGKVSVYIFETTSGQLITRLGRLGNVVLHLTFSADGRRLAATLGGGQGMRLWEMASWRQIAEDGDYGGKNSLGAAFEPRGALYTVADDGLIRLYGANGRIKVKVKTQSGDKPSGIAVHPDGTMLAVGFADTTAVEVYEAGSLRFLYDANASGISGGDLGKVAWSADGERLYAGGRYGSPECPVLIWLDQGRGCRTEVPLSQNTVMQLLPCGDYFAVGAHDPAFGTIAADGTKRVWQESVTANMRDKLRNAFTISADGRLVRFGLGHGDTEPVLFDLAAFRLSGAPNVPANLAAPKITGLTVTDWENKLAPKLNGKPIALQDYEISRALAIAPDSSRFALGTEYWLRAYRADGGELWKKPTPGIAYGVNITGNGKLAVATYTDGTIRWHRLSDGEELLALFVYRPDRRFIAWTPKGYYAASPGGEDLIGWHINRGFDQAPDFYPAHTFATTFRRPDIVARALDI